MIFKSILRKNKIYLKLVHFFLEFLQQLKLIELIAHWTEMWIWLWWINGVSFIEVEQIYQLSQSHYKEEGGEN